MVSPVAFEGLADEKKSGGKSTRDIDLLSLCPFFFLGAFFLQSIYDLISGLIGHSFICTPKV